MKQNGTKIFTVVIVLFALALLGYYIHLSNVSAEKKDVVVASEKDILLNYNMENDYPKTARDAVKLHCRYLKYVYSGEFAKNATEDEIFTMNQQIRELFDEELLEYNSSEQQLQALKDELALYEVNKQKFVSYTLAEASQIEYNTENDKEYAKMRVTVAMTVDGDSFSADEEYILRKDEEGKWKILGWQAIEKDQTIQEGDNK